MINITENINQSPKISLNRKTSKELNFFWFGFVLYSAAYTLTTTTTVSYIFCQLLESIGLVFFIPSAFKLIKWRFSNTYLRVVFFLYCCWQALIIARGFTIDYENIKLMLFDAESGLFRFLVPLILLFPKNLIYYKKIVVGIISLSLVFIFFDILFINNLLDLNYDNNNTKFTFEHFVKILSISSGVIFLTYPYQSNRTKYIALFVLVVSLIFSLIRARRALIFMTLSPIILSYILYLYEQKKMYLTLIIPYIIGSFYFLVGFKSIDINNYKLFNLFSERLTEDTRSGVEEYFYKDMSTTDWIIGKGINGKYFCPNIDLGGLSNYRIMIETDYLNIILKGGIISLGLLLVIAIPAIIKGLFYSKNILAKAAAIWISLWLIELYPANVTTFSLHYLLFWISIGICYSKHIRNLSEKTLKTTFLSRI
jgi:hypothetical protein